MTTVVDLFLSVFTNTLSVAMLGMMLWTMAEFKKPNRFIRALLLIPPVGIIAFFGVCLFFCYKLLEQLAKDYFKN